MTLIAIMAGDGIGPEVTGQARRILDAARDYHDVAVTHMDVDSAAMQLVRDPGQFDVVVTGNPFGDILSGQASMCAGSIGMVPSAAPRQWAGSPGLCEAVHDSAPDIAGQDKANPCSAILSAAMMLRHSLDLPQAADRVGAAVLAAIARGARTPDLGGGDSTEAMADAVLPQL